MARSAPITWFWWSGATARRPDPRPEVLEVVQVLLVRKERDDANQQHEGTEGGGEHHARPRVSTGRNLDQELGRGGLGWGPGVGDASSSLSRTRAWSARELFVAAFQTCLRGFSGTVRTAAGPAAFPVALATSCGGARGECEHKTPTR